MKTSERTGARYTDHYFADLKRSFGAIAKLAGYPGSKDPSAWIFDRVHTECWRDSIATLAPALDILAAEIIAEEERRELAE